MAEGHLGPGWGGTPKSSGEKVAPTPFPHPEFTEVSEDRPLPNSHHSEW